MNFVPRSPLNRNQLPDLRWGNERRGDCPWQGCMYRVTIADYAASPDAVQQLFVPQESYPTGPPFLSIYQLNGQGDYPEQVSSLPNLFWQGTVSTDPNKVGALIAPDHWLSTETAVASITQRIREHNQFTIDATFRPTDVS